METVLILGMIGAIGIVAAILDHSVLGAASNGTIRKMWLVPACTSSVT